MTLLGEGQKVLCLCQAICPALKTEEYKSKVDMGMTRKCPGGEM